MNYRVNNSILIIFFIYVLSFYQTNCDNTINNNRSNIGITNNNNSNTTMKPSIIGKEEEEVKQSKIFKKAEPKFGDINDSNKSDEIKPMPSKSRNKPGSTDLNNTKTPVYTENSMAVITQKPIITISNTSKEVSESNKTTVIAVSEKPAEAINTSSTTTTTTTTTTIKPTTTTKPLKPTITFAKEELPEPATKPLITKPVQSSSNTTIINEVTTPTNITLNSTAIAATALTHSVEDPIVQYSKEQIPTITSKRDYIIPVVALIFAIPIILAIATIMYRRAKDYWETRHYRRMDFLIDEMYND